MRNFSDNVEISCTNERARNEIYWECGRSSGFLDSFNLIKLIVFLVDNIKCLFSICTMTSTCECLIFIVVVVVCALKHICIGRRRSSARTKDICIYVKNDVKSFGPNTISSFSNEIQTKDTEKHNSLATEDSNRMRAFCNRQRLNCMDFLKTTKKKSHTKQQSQPIECITQWTLVLMCLMSVPSFILIITSYNCFIASIDRATNNWIIFTVRHFAHTFFDFGHITTHLAGRFVYVELLAELCFGCDQIIYCSQYIDSIYCSPLWPPLIRSTVTKFARPQFQPNFFFLCSHRLAIFCLFNVFEKNYRLGD